MKYIKQCIHYHLPNSLWLGLPVVGLFGRNTLQLPLQSIGLGYKQDKARIVLELRESTDLLVRAAGSQIRTGRKWKAQEEVDLAISRLNHRKVVGRVQEGRAGLGRSETPLFWSKASKEERRAMADLVMWSEQSKTILLVELTVPWDWAIEAANERKRAKYADLAEECREAGWKAITCPVEVGCRGFVGSSTVHLLRDMGCTGARCRKAIKELAEEAEKGSFWLWLRRIISRGWQGEIPAIAPPPGDVLGLKERNNHD